MLNDFVEQLRREQPVDVFEFAQTHFVPRRPRRSVRKILDTPPPMPQP